jgi:hypothetical protein
MGMDLILIELVHEEVIQFIPEEVECILIHLLSSGLDPKVMKSLHCFLEKLVVSRSFHLSSSRLSHHCHDTCAAITAST